MAIECWRPFGSTLDRWDPLRGLGEIQSEVNRLFDSFFGRPAGLGAVERVWAPATDMYETKDVLVVSLELPGVKEKEVQVSITNDILTVKGERSQLQEVKDENYHRLERWFGKFERNIPLPLPVQTDKAKATYRDGVLEIKLPKAEAVKPKEIKIDVL
ncbi:MAG: Hsp20/alpha crystallin family protein [Candidatus Rokubacteria bacterium]|nr:Hsp20/alpha crystallin family protein [Candidatus Rokubacteria bacterium]